MKYALDVETTGDTKDCRKADFYCAAIAPTGIVTHQIPTVSPDSEVVIHNAPYDQVVLKQWDGHWSDTKIIAHMAGVQDTTLKGMVRNILHRPTMGYEEARDQGKLEAYCLWDANNTLELEPILLDMLAPRTRQLYEELEKPLLSLWARMTLEGSFYIDHTALEEYRHELVTGIGEARGHAEDLLPRGRMIDQCSVCGLYAEDREKGQMCIDDANHKWVKGIYDPALPTNVNSPEQLLKAFQSMGLPVENTDIDTLRYLKERGEPIGDILIRYRHRIKRLSTYVDPWLASPPGERMGGIWNPTGIWTGGRVSSSAFNMQNIPKELEHFLWPEEGHVLLSFDNAQLEIRTAAAASQDEVLMKACASEDVHSTMQKQLGFEDRRLTKIYVFLTMYDGGIAEMGAAAFRQGVVATPTLCQEAQDTIRSKMPGWFRYCEEVRHRDVVDGLFGRVHYIPEGAAYHREKQAINCNPQGGAGDVLKYQLREVMQAGYTIRRQVHDSLTVEVPAVDEADARVDVIRIMEGAVDLGVPLKVEYQQHGGVDD